MDMTHGREGKTEGCIMRFVRILTCLVLIAILTVCCAVALAEEALRLPGALRVIGEEAFAGWKGSERVILPDSVQEIQSKAFAGSGIKAINLPKAISYIAEDAFEDTALSEVTAEKNTYAYRWAVRKGFIAASGALKLEIVCGVDAAQIGDRVNWTITAAGGSGDCVYCFDIYRDGEFIGTTGDTRDNYLTYTLDKAGSYSVTCAVADGEEADRVTSKALQVAEAQEALSAAIACDVKVAKVGEGTKWTVTASGGSGDYSYYFELFKDGALLGHTEVAKENFLTHTFAEVGVYYVTCRVSDAKGEVTVTSGEIKVSAAEKLSAKIACDLAEAAVGDDVKWTVTPGGGSGDYSYYFEIFRNGSRLGKSEVAKENFLTYTFKKTGTYYVTCQVSDGSATVEVSSKALQVTATDDGALAIVGLDVDASRFMTTETHTWSVTATGGTSPYRYSYALTRGGKSLESQSYSSSAAYAYTFFQAGDYALTVRVRDAENNTVSENFSFTVTLDNETLTGVVRIYVDCDSKGNIKKSSSSTGHYELQINNGSGSTISFDNHVLNNPVFSYGKGSGGEGLVKVFDSNGISRTSSASSFKLYTFEFSTTADKVNELLNSELRGIFLNTASESWDGSTYNYDVVDSTYKTYQIKSSNCFTALARWCKLLGYGTLSSIQSSSSSYTDYIAWKLYDKYGSGWDYVATYYM